MTVTVKHLILFLTSMKPGFQGRKALRRSVVIFETLTWRKDGNICLGGLNERILSMIYGLRKVMLRREGGRGP